jgi:hypothetical protein
MRLRDGGSLKTSKNKFIQIQEWAKGVQIHRTLVDELGGRGERWMMLVCNTFCHRNGSSHEC